MRAGLTVGFCSAFTTMSTFAYAAVQLGAAGQWLRTGNYSDLPLVLEVVDATDKIEAVLPEFDRRMGGGLITLEKVKVILHRPDQG